MTKDEIKILICDDSILARKLLKDALLEIGCENFFEAKNGIESVEKYMIEQPNLIFLDIVMPGVNGVEVTKKIMAQNSDAYIVMVSSVGTKSFLQEALEAGARDFLQKPFSNEAIANIVEKICAKS